MMHCTKLQLVCFMLVLHLNVVAPRPTVFRSNERYPNQDESEVCGRIRDVIPRDSGRYRRILIRNTNNEATYANDDSRRMTSRAKSKLDVLASRVTGYWSGVKVKVLLAWTDQIDPNDPTSLHYEGRSLRLQLSDGDRNKLGRLAGFASEAGFDWVQNKESEGYISASVIPDVCQTSVDLVFLLDGSGSVGSNNFLKVKSFVKKVVDFFNVGVSGTHIAVVTYESFIYLEFPLNKHYTKSALKDAVDKIIYRGQLTYTGEALDYVRNNVFTTTAGMRSDPGIPKVLVLLTDGYSNGKDVYNPASLLKDQGVSIFSIGVGGSFSVMELNDIATDPDKDYVFQLDSFNALANWVDRLSSVSCSEGSLIKSCDDSITTVTSGSFKYFRTEFDVVTEDRVSVEVRDIKGISHLYASATSKNPGPLDPQSVKNEDNNSPRAVSVKLHGTKTLFVAVQGQNSDNEFSLSFWDNLFASSNFEVAVTEEQPANFVTELAIIGDTTSLIYSITDGNDDGFFKIETNSPRISTTKAIDREVTSQYSLVIVAEDTTNKCHRSRAVVLVNISDINDNAPEFIGAPYTASVHENAQRNTLVKTVQATDRDSGANGEITYSITNGNSGNVFSIDSSSGKVILDGSLDYEALSTYSLTIRAEDSGSVSRFKETTLQVTVLDVNESPSISCAGNCIMSVSEASGSGTFVGSVTSTDPDTKSVCTPQFSVSPSVKDTFMVDSNGHIKIKTALDRETTPQYVFLVTVSDCGSPVLSANVRVTVTVGDVNDNDPKFATPYDVDILENEIDGSNVVQVKAVDDDEGANGTVRYSLDNSVSSVFAIDSITGAITTKVELDYETDTKYSFTVTATDQGPGARTGTTAVTVNVVDVNDNKPVFQNTPYVASVAEDASTGSFVTAVKANDVDLGTSGIVVYSIVSGNIGIAFEIDANSGNLTVRSSLDRETRSSYSLVVEASDRGSPSQNTRATVAIAIDDVNDNDPVFQGLPYTKTVSENTGTDLTIFKVSATDNDAGLFGQISYSITNSVSLNNTFDIDSNGNIILKKKLNYEGTKSYTLRLEARDGGGRTAQADVKIFVEDYNDNSPVFVNAPYTSSVAENVNIGEVVDTVKATDEDSGPRGSVTYSITAGNVGNAFTISASGVVTVSSGLDRETTESYNLTIKATDNGLPTLSATTTMTVTVTDINDNKPRFGKSSYSFTIAENNNVDAEVGRLGPATDRDKGVNAEIDYTIVSGNSGGPFAFKPTGELVAKLALNRETTASYDLVIEAKDRGTPPLSTRVPVHVEIADENDEIPSFLETPYNCQISENSASNSFVCQVQASDNDEGLNGTVMYELVAQSSTFSLHQANGEIRAKVTLDREQTPSYSFTVRAKDGGNPSKTSTVTVNVAVVDKNDNEPLFNQTKYEFDVLEDASTSKIIGRVLATDKDEGVNKQVVYSIIGGNINNAFQISPTNGDIQVNSNLDRETDSTYTLMVQVTDKGSPALFSSSLVIVSILDVNDNDPQFIGAPYSGKIGEDASVGSTVVQVKASDADSGDNGKVTYIINSGVNKDHFMIEPDTGVIRTATALDYETISSYVINVAATDGGTSPRTVTARVNIAVENKNDNAPAFVSSSPVVWVSEDVAKDTNIVQFNATDKDGGILTFSITSGNTAGAFKIHSDSGLVTTGTKLDRETTPLYNLTVRVRDKDNQFSTSSLDVIVVDVNDNTPLFEPSRYAVNVTEDVAPGPIVTVAATDKDNGTNAQIFYSIDSTSSQKFTIDSTSGEISTNQPLDHENGARYVIQVTAKDNGVPLLSSLAQVVVTVLDTNDNKPFFKNDFTTSLRENTAKGEKVLRVEATDIDSGINAEIEYSITSGNSAGFFTVGANSGIIEVAKPVDKETNPTPFTLTVLASNKVPYIGSPPSAKTSATVTITIEDVNDNAPVITNTVYIVDVPEDAKSPRLVVDVDATDNDVGVNSEIEYTITSGNVQNVFAMDTSTGIVSVKGSLDRETLPLYTLKIRASDKGTPSLYSEKDFTVNITDVDDNPPTFGATDYTEWVSEGVAVNTSVITVQATDADSGANAKLTYAILSGNSQGHFTIHPDTGEVLTDALLDYENIEQYTLVLTAKDTKHTAQVSLSIRVVNINDNNPVFKPDRYSEDVAENVGQNVLITTLKATDQDPFGGLTYIIVSGNNENKFSLDPSTGELRTAALLDRETTDFYNVSVRVTDGGVPALSDHGVVEIHVTDINDNTPKFNTTSIQGNVKENSKVGVKVLTVQATDRDIAQNAELRYSITKDNSGNVFKLDSSTGVLSVNGNINREKTSSYSLEVTAQDKGSPSLTSAPFAVYVEVLDENDNDPLFTGSYYRNVIENLSPGTFVEEVKATDQDIGVNAEIRYFIKSGSHGHFTIDNKTGIIETTVALDREDVSSYVIVIEAKDRGTPSRQSTTTVNINVLDANDNKPAFNVSSLEANVTEGQPRGLHVAKVMATDADFGNNSQVEYTLTSVLGRSMLHMDRDTGVVTTLVAFDYEQEQRYVFQVTATDKGKPSLTVTADLVVNVVDIDDNCPEFFPKVYNATVQENIPYTQPILTVTATDKDSGQHQDLNYGIRSGNTRGSFSMHPYTGVLTPGVLVDRELSSTYHLVVRAGSDYCGVNVTEGEDETSGGPLSSSVADVYITVTDMNDNPPDILQKNHHFIFTDINTNDLGWLNATDHDEGMNAKLEFSLHSVTRVQSQRTLTILATDKGSPPLSSNTTWTIDMEEKVSCEAMSFDVSPRGHVTVRTLCIFVKAEVNDTALAGNSLKFECGARGNTKPEYVWTRDGVPLGSWSETGDHVIKSLTKDDTGDYRCKATSAAGTILSTKIVIDVKEAPSIIVHPEDTWAEIGQESSLHCLAKGDSPMYYSWYRDNVLLPSVGELQTDKKDLVFKETVHGDEGEYFCEATNDVGKEPARSRTALLKEYSGKSVILLRTVLNKPYPEESCQYLNITNVKEHLQDAVSSKVAILPFKKPTTLCNLTQCFNKPCKNGGVCQTGETAFTCDCPRGWTGTYCEEDQNECAMADTETCVNNGTCVNQPGSFSCNCAGNTFGKRCQFVKSTCEPNTCASGEKCYPKETAQKYECLSNVVTVSMTFKLDKLRTPWQDWMKYDVAKEIENALQNRRNAKQGGQAKRKRRDVVGPDYSACSVRVVNAQPKGTEVELEVVLVCSSSPSKDYVCEAMLAEGKVSSCTGGKKVHEELEPTEAPTVAPVSLDVPFIVLDESKKDTTEKKDIDATEAIDRFDTEKLTEKLEANGMTAVELTPRSPEAKKQEGSALSGGAIAGVSVGVIVLVIVALVVLFVVLRTRRKEDKRFNMRNRSIHAQGSRSRILQQDISMRELEASEARGVDNQTYSQMYERDEGNNDSEDGKQGFMFHNNELSPKKNDAGFMKEIESAPWYHGSISRAKAEDLLGTSDVGTFLVRGGVTVGEFHITTKCSEDDPIKFRHIAVNRRQDVFVAVCGPNADAEQFTTFDELIDYLRSTPTHFEDGGAQEEVLLKGYISSYN